MTNSLVFLVCYFSSVKNDTNFCLIKKWVMLEIADMNVFKIMPLLNNLVIICKVFVYIKLICAGFKTIMLCSVHSFWLVKYEFSAKIWFIKTSTRIVKYESQVIKLNYLAQNVSIFVKYIYIYIYIYIYFFFTVLRNSIFLENA